LIRERLVIGAGALFEGTGVIFLAHGLIVVGIALCVLGLGLIAELRSRNTVSVERSLEVAAEPGLVWSLLGRPAAWSLRPGCWAFDVTGSAGAGRFRVSLDVSRPGGMRCDALEVTGEPGRSLCLSSGPQEAAALAYTVSVVPAGRGTRAVIGVRTRVRRGTAPDARARWRKDLTAWLRECAAVLEGRRPWPGDDLPADVRAACTARGSAGKAVSVSASALVLAPADRVWRVLWDPATALLVDPDAVAAGRVPGTPARQPGEMQYVVTRAPDGRLFADILVVLDVTVGRSALVRSIGHVETEERYLFEPEASGTRFTLSNQFSQPAAQARRDLLQNEIAEIVARCKTVIEDSGR
jgi:Polyketide cyclase / dehydrase and lipid transport